MSFLLGSGRILFQILRHFNKVKIFPNISSVIQYKSVLGEMVFSVVGQTEIYGVKNITAALQDGLKELGSQSDVSI